MKLTTLFTLGLVVVIVAVTIVVVFVVYRMGVI